MIRQACATRIRALGNDECEAVLMTDSLARDGHIIDPAGMVLSNYLRNPIILWQHNPECPVGIASNITRYSNRIAARIAFAPVGVSSTADEVRGLVKGGVVTAMSIGFDVIDAEPLDPHQGNRGGLHITKSELLECSFVSVPADTGAVVTARGYRNTYAGFGRRYDYAERQAEKLRLRVAVIPAHVAPFSAAGGPAGNVQRQRDAKLAYDFYFARAARQGPSYDLTERRRAVEALRRAP
jgi:uncharacterized protein